MLRIPTLFTLTLVVGCGNAPTTLTGNVPLEALGRPDAEVLVSGGGEIRTAQISDDGFFEVSIEPGIAQAIAFRSPDSHVFAQLIYERNGALEAEFVPGDAPLHAGSLAITDDRSSCRGLGDDPGIQLRSNFLLMSEVDLANEDLAFPSPDSDDDLRPDHLDDDDDGDGLCDDDDEDPNHDEPSDDRHDDGRSDLPYAVKLDVGDEFQLMDAFREKGPEPSAILAVEMEAGDWRLQELLTDESFTVTEEDCAHTGNRDVGRDRIFVEWKNQDGSREIDHLDLRYCGN